MSLAVGMLNRRYWNAITPDVLPMKDHVGEMVALVAKAHRLDKQR